MPRRAPVGGPRDARESGRLKERKRKGEKEKGIIRKRKGE